MFIPFFINLGFKVGVPVFDEKVEYIRDVYKYLAETYPFHGLNIIMLLMKAGYYFDDMEKYVLKRLDEIHKVTVVQAFDMYEDDITKIRQLNKWRAR